MFIEKLIAYYFKKIFLYFQDDDIVLGCLEKEIDNICPNQEVVVGSVVLTTNEQVRDIYLLLQF